jgi:transposase
VESEPDSDSLKRMNEQRPPGSQITEADWERTPDSVKQVLMEMAQRLGEIEQQLASLQAENELLKEQSNRTSKNSSQAPSSDAPKVGKQKRQEKSGKKRGGQPGHEGHSRSLYAVEQCQRVIDHYPEVCRGCGGKLSGEDAAPYRHQIVEIPPITPQVEEHRLHQRECQHCGRVTRAVLPKEINPSGYGPRVVATAALLSGMYRQSQRMVQSAMPDLFGVSMCLGSVNRLRQEASRAVAQSVEEAQQYVQQQPVVGADETSWIQENADGANERGSKAWLWVAVTPLVTYFQVLLSRSTEAAQTLLGATFGGILTSDRHGGYNWVDLERRQLCWAHLKREFIKISERSGVSAQLGEALVKQQRQLFQLWHRVRDGTLARADFIELADQIRVQVKALLEEAADYEIGSKEKTPLAQTVRTCRQLLKVEPALWLFVTVEGVEPTNNAAERAIRPAVLWRRTSFGTHSQAGSHFVARMLTVVTTLRSQERNVLEYMTVACRAAREGQPSPSLLPQVAATSENQI